MIYNENPSYIYFKLSLVFDKSPPPTGLEIELLVLPSFYSIDPSKIRNRI
jgi:hypothetical protein